MPVSLDAIKADPQLLRDLAEDQWFERKSASIAPRDVAKALVAFANAEGGILAIGVSRDGGLGGFATTPTHQNEIRQAAMNYSEPLVSHKVHRIPCLNRHGEADEVLLLEVEPSEQLHRLTDGTVYLRVGDETRSLSHEQATYLGFDKGISQFDGALVPDTTLADFDEQAVLNYRDVLGSRLDEIELLKARGLFREQGGKLGATWAGILLFGKVPSIFYPNAYVRVIQYQGTRPETGSRMNIVLDEIIEGPIPMVIDRTRHQLRACYELGMLGG